MFKTKMTKMWAEYDHSKFPIVKVQMRGIIKDDTEFEQFLTQWKNLYKDKEDFIFIFDTSKVGWVNPKYALKMAYFISTLKKEPVQYLKRSIIIISNIWVRTLLCVIFALQSPVCPIDYYTDSNTISIELLQKSLNKINI